MARLPQPRSVLLHCPEQLGTLRSRLPTPTHLLVALKVWRPEWCYVLCSSKPSASTMPGHALCQREGVSLARQIRGTARLRHHSPVRSSPLQHPDPFQMGPKEKKSYQLVLDAQAEEGQVELPEASQCAQGQLWAGQAGQKLAEVLKLTATSKQPKGIQAESPSPHS